jgi:hypothetical protein
MVVTGVFFKFGVEVLFRYMVEVGIELSIVNALYRLRITDQLIKSYALYEWCALNRLSNAYFDAKFKKTTFTLTRVTSLLPQLPYSKLLGHCNHIRHRGKPFFVGQRLYHSLIFSTVIQATPNTLFIEFGSFRPVHAPKGYFPLDILI